jgi:hypothetical protein
MRTLARRAVVSMFALMAAGCDGNRPAAPAVSQNANRPAAVSADDKDAVIAALRDEGKPAADSGLSALPPGHPPIDGPAMPPPRKAPPGPAVQVTFEAPDSWQSETPANAMRKYQYKLPAAEGDSEPGEVVVFYFGPGEGGGTQANLDRWRGQFKDAAGNPLPADATKAERFKAGEWDAVLIELAGTFAAGMPGMGPTTDKPGFRMIGGVVEAPGGSYFVKATGPDATIQQHHDAIVKFILSARPAQ